MSLIVDFDVFGNGNEFTTDCCRVSSGYILFAELGVQREAADTIKISHKHIVIAIKSHEINRYFNSVE